MLSSFNSTLYKFWHTLNQQLSQGWANNAPSSLCRGSILEMWEGKRAKSKHLCHLKNVSTTQNNSHSIRRKKMKDNQHEQLFTELTPAEAAVVEGGLRLTIDRIQAIKAGADSLSNDDTYITVNGTKIWGNYGMNSGQTRLVDQSRTIRGSSARVELFDADWPDSDDSMGGFTAGNTNGRQLRARVSGSGSTYDIYYRGYA
jgi:preprotein translocase subunit YajC